MAEVIGGTWEKRDRPAVRRESAPAGRALSSSTGRPGLAKAEQLQGKEMSYNNYVDADAAWRARMISTNPRWRSSSMPTRAASRSGRTSPRPTAKAHACDPISAYGGVIAANRPVTVEMARQVAEIFTEVIIAPGTPTGRWRCSPQRRIYGSCWSSRLPAAAWRAARIDGGLLVQPSDRVDADHDDAVELEAGRRSAGRRRRPWPISSSPGGLPAR